MALKKAMLTCVIHFVTWSFSLLFLRATITNSWGDVWHKVQRVWHPETVRKEFLNVIVTFQPSAGVYFVDFLFLAVAGCQSHLVQYGRLLALYAALYWLVFTFKYILKYILKGLTAISNSVNW